MLVALPVFACSRAQTSQETNATEQVKTAAEQAGEKLADSWLTAKIQAQFFVDDDIKSRYINVSARDGVVKLKGFVESDDARRQVLEITRNTDGVKQIDERQLLVGRRPASRSTPPRRRSPRRRWRPLALRRPHRRHSWTIRRS